MSTQYINAVYYPSWRCYKERPPSCLDTASVTHIFYAFVGYVSKENDSLKLTQAVLTRMAHFEYVVSLETL